MKRKTKYSFCEPVVAGSNSKWCIRPLTGRGQKLGGGVDTESLCGRVRKGYGWDLQVRLTEHNLERSACPKCVEIWKENGGKAES